MSKAPLTGSTVCAVPGTQNPLSTTVPGMGGPSIARQSGLLDAVSMAQPRASRRAVRAEVNAAGSVIL